MQSVISSPDEAVLKASKDPPSPVVSAGTAGDNASGDSSVDEWGTAVAAKAPPRPAAPLTMTTSAAAAAAAAAAAFRDEDHHHEDFVDHLGLLEDEVEGVKRGDDGSSWPWEGSGGAAAAPAPQLAALRTSTATALPAPPPQQQQQQQPAAATNSGGGISPSSAGMGSVTQQQWTPPPGGNSVSPRSTDVAASGPTTTTATTTTAATAAAPATNYNAASGGNVFYVRRNPGDAEPTAYVAVPLPAGATAPPGSLVFSSTTTASPSPSPPTPTAMATAAAAATAVVLPPPAIASPAPVQQQHPHLSTAAVLSQLQAQHASLVSTSTPAPAQASSMPPVPVPSYRSSAAAAAAGGRLADAATRYRQHPSLFDFGGGGGRGATSSSAAAAASSAAAARAALAFHASASAVGPSVPDIPDAWAAAALCDELVDLGAHPGAHRGDPWSGGGGRRSLSFGDLAAVEAVAAANASAAAAVATATTAAHDAADLRGSFLGVFPPRPATAAPPGVSTSSKRRFSNVGGARPSTEQRRYGNSVVGVGTSLAPLPAFSPHGIDDSHAEPAGLLPLSALDDGIEDDEGAESDSGWTPAVAAARRRLQSEKVGNEKVERDDDVDDSNLGPAPPVAPPQLKRARSVSCLSSRGRGGGFLAGGLLPDLVPGRAAPSAALAAHAQALRRIQLQMQQQQQRTHSPSSPTASSSPLPREPVQQHDEPFASSNDNDAGSTQNEKGDGEQELEQVQQQQLPQPPPGVWLSGPPVPKERGVVLGEVVWARMLSFPWWPAQVRRPPPGAHSLRHKPGSVYVVFFGDGNCAWLSPRSLDRFACGYEKRSAKPRKDLQKALDEAWVALGVERPRAKANDASTATTAAAKAKGVEELDLPLGFDESRPAIAPYY